MNNWRGVAVFLGLAIVFALAYHQAPLYTSNQYQYFLHGLARAGLGTLAEDWLANTADPTPVFSALVELLARLNLQGAVPVLYGLLMGVYLYSLAGIVEITMALKRSGTLFLVFLGLVIASHSAGLRTLLTQGLGADWGYLLDGGVAGQRLLGPVFQPSVFGVLLLVSIWLYLGKRATWAVGAAVLAATVHPTYLLSAGVLVLTYLLDTALRERKLGKAARLGAVALALVTPVLIQTWSVYGGSSQEVAARAREILVTIRIPHHAQVGDWLDASVGVKVAVLMSGMWLVRKSRLFWLMAVPAVVAVVLTLVQALSGDLALALLFPWRISTWLMPLALVAWCGWLAKKFTFRMTARRETLLRVGSGLVLTLAVVAGLGRGWFDAREAANVPSREVAAYVREHAREGALYLVPVKMYDFRLMAAAPVYGDFFAIPYRDEDVIEWYSRFLNAKHFYEPEDCTQLADLARQGVTDVVLPADFGADCPGLVQIYADENYELYRLELEE